MKLQLSKPICHMCETNEAIGLGYGGNWVCGMCIIKLEDKIKEQRSKFIKQIKKEIKEDGIYI